MPQPNFAHFIKIPSPVFLESTAPPGLSTLASPALNPYRHSWGQTDRATNGWLPRPRQPRPIRGTRIRQPDLTPALTVTCNTFRAFNRPSHFGTRQAHSKVSTWPTQPVDVFRLTYPTDGTNFGPTGPIDPEQSSDSNYRLHPVLPSGAHPRIPCGRPYGLRASRIKRPVLPHQRHQNQKEFYPNE